MIAFLFTSWLGADVSKISLDRIYLLSLKKKKSCTLHEDLQMPGTRHAGCPAKPLVVSLEMRSFHSKKEVRLQRGEFVRLHQYVGCSDPTEQNFVALPEQQALAVNLNA